MKKARDKQQGDLPANLANVQGGTKAASPSSPHLRMPSLSIISPHSDLQPWRTRPSRRQHRACVAFATSISTCCSPVAVTLLRQRPPPQPGPQASVSLRTQLRTGRHGPLLHNRLGCRLFPPAQLKETSDWLRSPLDLLLPVASSTGNLTPFGASRPNSSDRSENFAPWRLGSGGSEAPRLRKLR